MNCYLKILILLSLIFYIDHAFGQSTMGGEKPRVIVTTDGEIDDQCSMVRFLLYTNEFDVEAIVLSSSQYHWRGHKWPLALNSLLMSFWMKQTAVRSGFRPGAVLIPSPGPSKPSKKRTRIKWLRSRRRSVYT